MTTIRADLRGLNGKPLHLTFADDRATALGPATLTLPGGQVMEVYVTELVEGGSAGLTLELRARAPLTVSYGAMPVRVASAQRREAAIRRANAVSVARWVPYKDD